MNKEIIFRAHPVFMLFLLKKLAFVLVLPVIKGAAQMLLYRRVTDVFLLEGAALAAAAALAFIILYVILRVLSLEGRGVSFGKVLTVKDISGFCERELYLKATDAEVKLTRAPADRRYGTCRVTFKAISGNADGARVRFLPYGETRRGFCDIYGIKPR